MVSRRRVLRCSAIAAVALAGCSFVRPDPDPDPVPSGRGEPPNGPTETPREGSVLDIRDFGARVDGETNDTEAVQDALDSADPGDTVLFPDGTTVVSGSDKARDGVAAIRIDGATHPDDLTITGEGRGSIISMDGGHERNHTVLEVAIGPGVDSLQLQAFVIDGNGSEQEQRAGLGGWNVHVGKTGDEAATPDITIEDVWSVNANQNGFLVNTGGCSLRRCTASDCTLHGFALDSWGRNRSMDPPITVRQSYASGNGLYGIDCSGGKILVEDFVAEGNRQGTKTTEEVVETTYRRCRFSANELLGYNRPTTASLTGRRADVGLFDVIAEGNGYTGVRFGFDTEYRVDGLLSRRNNVTGQNHGNLMVRDNSFVDAGLVISHDAASGAGLVYGSSQGATIDSYVHWGNPDGGVVSAADGLTIARVYQGADFEDDDLGGTSDETQDVETIRRQLDRIERVVPTAAEVGAGSGR